MKEGTAILRTSFTETSYGSRPAGGEIKRIDYGDLKVPSWSWMAYNGGIQFLDIPFSLVEWIDNLRFHGKRGHALRAEIGQFWKCRIEQEETRGVILDSGGTKRGWLQYDVDGGIDVHLQRCVVVGRIHKEHKNEDEDKDEFEYYILVVSPTCSKEEYERIGIGMVQASYVSRVGLNVRIV